MKRGRGIGMLKVVGLAAFLAMAGPARAGELEEKGRAVLEKYQQCVVTFQLVVKHKFSAPQMGSEEHESKSEATGVIIDPSGLCVLALSATDASSMYESMMSMMGEDERFKVETNLGDIKMLLADGAEVPARVVLRDKDLDLAFARPVTPLEKPLPAISLADSAAVDVLDPMIGINRLGVVTGRVASAGIERVQAIIRKPRTFYVPGNDPTFSSLGSPMFTLDGKIVGVTVMRTIKGEGRASGGFGQVDDNLIPVVIPAADVLEAAEQAKEAPAAPPAEQPAPAPETPTADSAGDSNAGEAAPANS